MEENETPGAATPGDRQQELDRKTAEFGIIQHRVNAALVQRPEIRDPRAQ